MARARRQPPPAPRASTAWPALILCATAFLVEVAALPATASSFRLPKDAVALAGLAVAAALALVAASRRRLLTLPSSPLALVLGALPVLQLASATWSSSPLRAVASAAGTGIWMLGILVIAGLPERDRHRIVAWAVAGASLSAVVLLLQAAGVELLPFSGNLAGRMRLTGLAGNPADSAIAAVLLLPLLLTGRDGLGRRQRLAAMVLLVVATLATLSTTAYVALAALLLAWLVHARSRRAWGVAVAGLLVATAVALAAGFGGRLERQLSHLRAGDWYTFLSARGDGWTAAAEMIRDHPLLGVGADAYTQRFFDSRLAWLDRRQEVGGRGELATHFEWAHSDPLQVAAELGLPGVLWMAALAWTVVRRRAPTAPLPVLATAAAMPFLFLHYPTHLAVGVLPLALVGGEMLAAEEVATFALRSSMTRAAGVVAATLLAVVGLTWQSRRVSLNTWQAAIEARIEVLRQAPTPADRARLAAVLEREVAPRIGSHPVAAPWLWRAVGKARLAGGDPQGAAAAFRTAAALCPHAEAELGLGMALAAEGRRAEGLLHLGRVARVNPRLAELISDPDLRQAVMDLTAARDPR